MRQVLTASLLACALLASAVHAAVTPLAPGWTAHTVATGIPFPLDNALVVDPATHDLYAITLPRPTETSVMLRRIAPDGVVTTLAPVTFGEGTLKFDPFAHVLYWSGGDHVIEQRDLAWNLLATIPWPSDPPISGVPIAVGPDHQLHSLIQVTVGGLPVPRIVRYDPSPGVWTPETDVAMPPPLDQLGIDFSQSPVSLQFDDAGRAFISAVGFIVRVDGSGSTQLGQQLLKGDLAVAASLAISLGALYDPSGGFQGGGAPFVSGNYLGAIAISPDASVYVFDRGDPTTEQDKSIVVLSQQAVPARRTTWSAVKALYH